MRRMRHVPLAPAAALAVAGGLLLAGCGGGSGTTSAAATTTAPAPSAAAKTAVEQATAKTEASTAHVEVLVVLRKKGASNALTYRADGSVAPGGGTLEIDRRSIGGGLQREIFTRAGGRLVIYTNPTATPLPHGKTWLKVDMSRYSERRYGANTSFLAGSDQDPLQALKLLASPAAKVTDLGYDWLPDRTLNTHYQGKVNLVAAAQAAGVKGAGLTALRTDLGDPTQTIDVWVGKKGAVARVEVRGPQKSPQGVLQLEEVTDFTAYGTKAAVRTPPAAKTADYFTLTR